ncbi:MAG: glycoside hydrolase family 9 protein [Bacteroidota bacterium]
MIRLFFSLLLGGVGSLLLAQSPSKFIHVDQFGYFPEAEKVAVLSDPQQGMNAGDSFSPGTQLEIKDATTNVTVWMGAPVQWNNGATHSNSGDRGWWLDFSDLTTPGDYYLLDPDSGERSAEFAVGSDVYDQLMVDAGRIFFYNRCNAPKTASHAEAGWTDGQNFTNPLQDTECSYVNDRENAALRRELSGGWFDAGDYNKYVTFAHGAVLPLLSAYRESPDAFNDAWNIPESGNGIPDLLDEVKWEVDWIRKMINPDGSVIIKMGSIDHGENALAPPSANRDRRYYGPTCTSASIATAGMLAQAAKVFSEFSAWTDYASDITDEAESTFAYWLSRRNAGTLEYDCDDGTIKAGDADVNDQGQKEMALTAATYLFELTGKASYNNYVRDHLMEAEYMQSGWWGPYKNEFSTAMVLYTELEGAHSATVTAIRDRMTPHVRDDWNGFYGFNEDDLYRAFMPAAQYGWGSNSIASRFGNMNRIMTKIVPAREKTMVRKATGMLHYLHGVNPLGLVYLSAMNGRGAERSVQEIYHTWFNDGTDWDNAETSLFGPAPGFLAGGPNKDFTVSTLTPPHGQPPMKSYLDWNTGWPQNSWEVTEPAIYYQAAYIRNLAAVMQEEILSPVVYRSPFSARAQAKTVLLEWIVETEENASYYEVEYLTDRDEWQRIGRVNATGAERYRLIHETPREGLNEYRLRQTDLDGNYAYSEVAQVSFQDRFGSIRLFPNPAATGVNLRLERLPVGGELRMFDAQGRQLFQTFLRQTRIDLPTAELPAGWYTAELSLGLEGTVWQEKFVIK